MQLCPSLCVYLNIDTHIYIHISPCHAAVSELNDSPARINEYNSGVCKKVLICIRLESVNMHSSWMSTGNNNMLTGLMLDRYQAP